MRGTRTVRRLLSENGMLSVLILLCLFFSLATWREQHQEGEAAARSISASVEQAVTGGRTIWIVARGGEADRSFAERLLKDLDESAGKGTAGAIFGDPAALRVEMERRAQAARGRVAIATLESYAPIIRSIASGITGLDDVEILTPRPYRWPTFLLRDNLRNVANQISVIAIVAVGMTMVIITGGIDLSVGSMVALAAVTVSGLVGQLGGADADSGTVFAAGAAAVLLCGLFGVFSGIMVSRFGVPPFIATLGMMQVASGIAYLVSKGKPIYDLPDRFVALGRGIDPLLGVPYAVILMIGLFFCAHILMSRTILGRHIYAVGGNAGAARLAGVPVARVLLIVYTIVGCLAGLGGVVMASQLKSGAPTYGLMYELYVIAAVVVGGTSLSGGEGKIAGTLIGAFIIAVIQNGMNLTNVESYTQKVVLGLVILGAVLLDRIKHRGLGGVGRTPDAGPAGGGK